ncbi:MAG TPA: hypothetical protein VER79_12590 [Candidatus Limnocylindrales bacterium]|nr:hypothetical protein [Candidatus Limnocylindrales bacterium]
MKSAQEIASGLEQLSNEYAQMFEGVERDGQIDEEEAQLGKEYAEEYRKHLLGLRRDIRDNMRALREQYRYESYLFKTTSEFSKAEQDVKYQELRQQEMAALAPFKALLDPIEKALNQARLSRAAFAEVRDTLQADPGAFVDTVGLPAEALNLSMDDELKMLVNALTRLERDWQGLRAEAAARIDQPDYAPHVSHLRGIDKGLERAVNDIGALLELAQEVLGDQLDHVQV